MLRRAVLVSGGLSLLSSLATLTNKSVPSSSGDDRVPDVDIFRTKREKHDPFPAWRIVS